MHVVVAKQTSHAILPLAVVRALEAAGAEPMSEEQVAAEFQAARAERRAKLKSAGADRS